MIAQTTRGRNGGRILLIFFSSSNTVFYLRRSKRKWKTREGTSFLRVSLSWSSVAMFGGGKDRRVVYSICIYVFHAIWQTLFTTEESAGLSSTSFLAAALFRHSAGVTAWRSVLCIDIAFVPSPLFSRVPGICLPRLDTTREFCETEGSERISRMDLYLTIFARTQEYRGIVTRILEASDFLWIKKVVG